MNGQGGKITKVRRRDDEIVDFDKQKIVEAIASAMKACDKYEEELVERLAEEVVVSLSLKFHERSIPAVEEILDIVEEVLVRNNLFPVAKSFILYREQHARMREMQSKVDADELMDGYLDKLDWRVKENSNMSYSLQGLNNHVASAISAHYWLYKIYPKEVREAHNNGDLHIHDLQLLSVYCCGWDLKDLLSSGFRGAVAKIESKPAKHFRTALGHIVNFFYTLQGEAAGAQALANFDTLLAPFIRYDRLTYNEVKQCLQEFMFNMNVPTRVGFQTPFTNITMDLVVPSTLASENVIIGGKPQVEKYSEFQEEMDMLNRAFAEVVSEGDATGQVFTFPIPTYNITKDFDWDNPALDPLWEMTAKYGIPYFSNFINSDMKPEDARSMCCRLRLDNRELRSRGGGLFGANPLTGSIGVVTLNLARIGYLSKDKEEYLSRVNRLLEIAKTSLEIKRKMLEVFTDKGLYPYSRYYLRHIKERFGEYWKNHFNTIGVLGMNESLLNFMHKDITTPEGKAFTIEVMDSIRAKMLEFQEKSEQLFNLEATPGEGTSYRFARIDKKQFPEIIVANEINVRERKAEPYYTNSTQLPVGFTDDIFEALDIQDDLQTKYTGGTVLHGFLGERLPSLEATKNLVRKISYNYRLPYYTITPTFSVCPVHGYLSGEHQFCPKCDAEQGISAEDVLENLMK